MKKPNILFILADDLGWMDIGAYGSQYFETPHLDALAKRGVKFTNAYSASPLCSPTRASLMTGKDPARLGLTTPSCHLPTLPEGEPRLPAKDAPWKRMIGPQSERFLPPDEFSIGKPFQEAGYDTALMGKWHLGLDEQHWPKHHGFDLDMGAPNPGPPSYFAPYNLINFPEGQEGQYVTDHLTDEAIKYLEQDRDNPFFLCLWHFAVHAPFQGKEPERSEFDEKVDPRGMQNCPTMASMIASMDKNIGRVLNKLDELGIREETIVVFFSDNGGNIHSNVDGTTPTNNSPLRKGKAHIHEGGVRVPLMIDWPGVTKPGSINTEIVASTDFYPTFLEMAGLPLRPEQHIDGHSFANVLQGGESSKREAFYCHFPHYIPATRNTPATSVRRGAMKLIRFYGEGDHFEPAFGLYDLDQDIGEAHNLADQQPELVQELDQLLDDYLMDVGGIVPVQNPAYDPAAEPPYAKGLDGKGNRLSK